MPWCPRCKSEYREGFTVCADCGCQLVDEERAEALVPLTFGEREHMETDRLETQERLREASAARRTFMGNSSYQDSSQRADDNRSSAWILLIIGVLGLVLVALGIVEVIPIHLGNPYLFYGVMIAIFLLFLVTGVMSMRSAKFFARKAESENSLRSILLNWCKENLRSEEIDREVSADGTPEEVLYFSRTSYIKEKLNHQFVNLDQDFLDKFVDDHVYGMVFEQNEDSNVAE